MTTQPAFILIRENPQYPQNPRSHWRLACHQLLTITMLRLLKRKMAARIRQALEKHWIAAGQHVPKYELQEKHFAHLKAVGNRQKLLELLPKNGEVAELGVYRGDFSALILEITAPAKLHLVDTWEQKDLRTLVEQKFAPEIITGQVALHAGLSTAVADDFAEDYFDWIYIDTDHSYNTTKAELEKYSHAIKPNGIIAGHDFIVGNWNGSVKYGVIEAVYEFCVRHDWEIIYLTMEQNEYPSFAIRRLLESTLNSPQS
ncbi:MAG: class I SAM-dependent methyltransferase [Saprospiraceae bacterium]